MKVIFIAAGSSTRLGKYTKDIPKGLLKINDKSIMEYQLDMFRAKKIDEIIIITGPNSDKFNFQNVVYVSDINHEKHDVLGSLMVAQDYLNDDVLTTYSDIIFDEQILEKMIKFSDSIGIGVDLNWREKYHGRDQHPISEADNVLIEDNKIIKIKKNITECKESQKIGEFVGLMRLSKSGAKIFLEFYKNLKKHHTGKFQNAPSLEKAYLTDMLQELIDSKINVVPIYINGKWVEIDTPQDIEIAKKLIN